MALVNKWKTINEKVAPAESIADFNRLKQDLQLALLFAFSL